MGIIEDSNHPSRTNELRKMSRDFFAPLLIFAGVVAVFLLWVTTRSHIILDFDEGMVLMRTMLMLRGYELHTDIWSDQPIVVPLLLKVWSSFFGLSLVSGRYFVMLFAALLATLLFIVQARSISALAGLSSVIALMLSAYFLHYGSACMIGAPTLALGMGALCFYILAPVDQNLPWSRRGSLFASGLLLSLAIGAKLFALEIIPVILVAGYVRYQSPSRLKNLKEETFSWLTGFTAGVAILLMLIGREAMLLLPEQLIGTNIVANKVFTDFNIEPFLVGLRQDWLLWPIVAIGIVLARVSADGNPRVKLYTLIPISWLTVALAGAVFYRPLSPHHYLTISLPLSWLAGIAVAQSAAVFKLPTELQWGSLCRSLCLPVTSIVFCVWSYTTLPKIEKKLRTRGRAITLEYVSYIEKLGDKAHWILTDDGVYGVATGLPVPPEAAVFSMKRQRIGELKGEDVRAIVEKYRPEVILLSRFDDVLAQFVDLMTERYEQVMPKFYVRKDVLSANRAG